MVNVEHREAVCDRRQGRALGAKRALDSNAADPVSILLVEDEGLIARDLEDTLTRLGYRVSGVASEGTEAIEMARELHPQLVVMDVSLRGEVDGIEAACAIQEDAPVPVIFLTGHTDTETLQRAVIDRPARLSHQAVPGRRPALRDRGRDPQAPRRHRSAASARSTLRRSAENLSLIDELTQLKNRRGFFELAEQALKSRPARAAHAWRCSSWT